jgi:threonyl-tRNA synthetase
MNDVVARDRWVLGWEGTLEFYNENKEWLTSICKRMQVPAFFKLMPHMSHYYAIKNEYQYITDDGANVQVSTVQWDVKDGERFNIGYIDRRGKKHPCPVIIHASSFGSIERTLCAILERIAHDEAGGIQPMFPVWLSPTQVRLIPVAEDYVRYCEELCAHMSGCNIRVDIDDRDFSVSKRVLFAEQEWIPYVCVVGNKERSKNILTVRIRRESEQRPISFNELVAKIHERTKDMPYRSLPMPVLLSDRPVFR